MLEPVSVGLKFAFLAVLYLFLLWVSRSALKDLRRDAFGGGPRAPVAAQDETGMHSAASLGALDGGAQVAPRLVVSSVPGLARGMSYDVAEGAVLGRGDVEIQLEDPFASSQHARLTRQGTILVIEDLGSTNGTYLNDELLRGPQPLHPGDRIRIGDSTFTYED
ncbi:MAG TPA: FHA domain-containing protein [Solirubrobacteraceae bacterium]|nr:FHA domain-containing protein [Solirubrobacteraceae bacterium]